MSPALVTGMGAGPYDRGGSGSTGAAETGWVTDGIDVVTALLAVDNRGRGLRSACARPPGRRGRPRLWWVAGLAAAGSTAGVVATGGPVPVGTALVGAGLAAASVVDAVEGRIPTSVARATTAASCGALVVHGHSSGDWGSVVAAVGSTALLAGLCLALWLAGVAGFGDVRLATGTSTALFGGLPALLVFLWIAVAAVGARRCDAVSPSGSGCRPPR